MKRHVPIVYLKIIKVGDTVFYKGRPYKVLVSTVSKQEMYAKLDGIENRVHYDDLDYKLTAIDFNRE